MKKEEKINAIVILEIIGKPKEYIVETLGRIIEQIENEKGINIRRKEIKKPILMKEKIGIMNKEKVQDENFYTTFAEIEVDAENILYLAILIFKYMPSHVEITYPEFITLSNNDWNDVLNEIVRRLHAYDEIVRITQVEKNILEKKLRSILSEKQEKEEDKKRKTKRKK